MSTKQTLKSITPSLIAWSTGALVNNGKKLMCPKKVWKAETQMVNVEKRTSLSIKPEAAQTVLL